jgi:tape measure domain-containing protein
MAAPELRLDVRLNLATFRTDLGRAAQAAASYYYPINLLINKQNLTKQLTAIGRSLGTTKYNIDLNDTSVELAAGKIDKLAASLKKLSGSIQIDFNAGGGTRSIGTAMKEMAAKLAKESKGDINRAAEQMAGMRGASPFGAGTRSVPGFKAAAKGMGIENAFKLFFQELQQVDPQSLKKALDDGSVMMMQENRELKQKFDKIQSSAEGLAQDLRAMGETAKATGRASLTAGGKTLYPQNYGLKIASLLSQVEKLDKDLRNVSGQSGGELLNNLTELSSVLRTASNSFVGLAGLSENLDQTLRGFDTATKAAASATIAYTERIRRRGGIEYGPSTQKLLPPSSTLSLREMGETMAQRYQAPSRGIKGLLPAGGKTPGEAITEAYIAELRRSFSSRNAIAGLLPPAVDPTPGSYRIRNVRPEPAPPAVETRAELFARRTRQAYINSAARAADERQSPLALPPAKDRVLGQPPLMTAPSIEVPRARPMGMTGAAPRGGPSGDGAGSASLFDAAKKTLQLKTAMDVAAASTKNFTASQIPLIGGIKNLAGEFGQAAKQVLLYGTAYKGLAFLTSLPGQILNAAKSQQQFANGLKVATQDTGTFAKELLYVDNVQRAFGLNLETTRTGFTRLYASMAPTGFDSGSIEKLFTGISAATASLQLTPDKAERVIYAFGQMASKGQIMSEELKGQLGDVLPGALAIFSKAAGMSVKEFSKAMEDGEFVGNRFREVFAKVSDELMNRFGTGAQAAGRSLQGLVNTVGGDFQRVLESLSPLANSAAQAILGPLGGSLKQLALSAQIATGEIERVFTQLKASQQNLQDLRTTAGTDGIITADEARQIKAAEQNVAALTAKYKSLQQAASDPAIAKQAQDITKFTEELGKAGTFVMNVAKTIGGILSPALNFLGTNLTTVISLITSFYIGFQTARLAAMALMGALLLYRTLSAILGFGPAALSANALAAAFRGLGIAATGAQVQVIGLRLALTALVASTVIGAVVGGIMLIAGAFASMRDRAKEASQSSRDAAKAAIDAASTGGVAQAAMSVQTILGESRKAAAARKALEGIMARSTKEQRAGVVPMSLTMEESVALKGSSLTEKMVKAPVKGKSQIQVPTKGDFDAIIRQFGSLAGTQDYLLKESKSALTTAQQVAKETGQNIPTPGVTPPETPEEDKKKTSLESYYSLQDQLAKAQTQADIDRLEAAFEHARAMVNAEYDLKEAKANSFQKKAIAFQKEIFAITSEQDAALFKNRNKVLAAAGSVAGGAGGGGGTGAIFGDTGRTFNAAGFVHGHFQNQNREALVKDTVEVVMALLSKGVSPELGSGARFTSGMNAKQVEALVRQGIGSHKQYASGVGAVDVFVPKGTQVPVPVSGIQDLKGAAGVTGSLPYGSQLMHLDPASRMGVPTGGAPGKIAPSVKRNELAEQQVALTAREANAASIEKEAEAIAKLEIATTNYVQSLVPTAEQSLQNQLLQQRITLTQNSFSPEILEAQLAFAEQELQVAENIAKNTEEINRLTAASGNNTKGINALTDANNQLKANLPVSAIQLLTKAIDDQVLSLVQRTKTAERDAADQERVNSLIIGGMTRQAAEAKVTAENLRSDYKKALEEATRQVEIAAAAEEVLAAARRLGKKETAEQTAEYNRQAQALKDAKDKKDALEAKAPQVEGAATGVEGSAVPKTTSSYIADGLSAAQEKLDQLTNTGYQVVQAANAIGEAFGTAFKGVITGSMTAREALAGMFQSVADHFADMVAQMIAEYLKMALIKGIMSIIGGAAGALGGGLSSGFNAGTSSAIDTGATGWANSFATPLKFANGGITPGGFTAFANGGVVTGPTLGLVGEGRYNEAVIPLPDGKSVPVQLSGGDGGNQINSNITVNVSNGQAQSNATGSNSSELGRKLEGAVKQVIVGELRPGGLLASR